VHTFRPRQLQKPRPKHHAKREPKKCPKSAILRRVPWRTVVREDSAVVTCCGPVGHGVMMGVFVVVDLGPTLVPVSL